MPPSRASAPSATARAERKGSGPGGKSTRGLTCYKRRARMLAAALAAALLLPACVPKRPARPDGRPRFTAVDDETVRGDRTKIGCEQEDVAAGWMREE